MSTVVRDKHFKLDQKKLDMAKKILGTKTETGAIEKALDKLIQESTIEKQRKVVTESILNRRKRFKVIREDVSNWVRAGRQERDGLHGL